MSTPTHTIHVDRYQSTRACRSRVVILLVGLLLSHCSKKDTTEVDPNSLSGTSWAFAKREGTASLVIKGQASSLAAKDYLDYERIEFTDQSATLISGTTKDKRAYSLTNGELVLTVYGYVTYLGFQANGNTMVLTVNQSQLVRSLASSSLTADIIVNSSALSYTLTRL